MDTQGGGGCWEVMVVCRILIVGRSVLPSIQTLGAIHSTKIQTGPTGKRGPPQKVDLFFRNFSGWTEPIH